MLNLKKVIRLNRVPRCDYFGCTCTQISAAISETVAFAVILKWGKTLLNIIQLKCIIWCSCINKLLDSHTQTQNWWHVPECKMSANLQTKQPYFSKAFVCSSCTEWSECWSPACLFASAPSQVNKPTTWPCCWETRRVCTIYKSNGPDDALMAAHMEALASLLAVASGKMTRTPHEGQVTRSMTGRKCVMGDADLKGRGSHWTPSERSFMLQARSVFRLCTFLQLSQPIWKSTLLRLCSIKKNPPHAFHTFSSSCIRSEECVCQKKSLAHKSPATFSGLEIGPPAEAALWLSSASVLEANRCFD